jgi:DNA repair protein SbcC/Rad50
MHIVRLELENIKSHKSAEFDFERGTTAITGANGAGKTTIIEAIAWTLFGFLDYNKADFVSRGEKKGTVRVTVETTDQKIYTIVRDTGSGYYVFDPTIKSKICSGGDEVTDFLRKILQVEPGTDLKELFQTAIGVPQGTFTADFLLSKETRKRKFDKLLKVEEYRNSAEKLKLTAKYTEGKRLEVWERIVRGEAQIESIDQIVAEQKQLTVRETELNKELSELLEKVKLQRVSLERFDELKRKIDETANQISKIELKLTDAKRRQLDNERFVSESKEAAEKQSSVESDYKLFQTATDDLKRLQTERNERTILETQIQKLESEIRESGIELKNLREKLDISVSAKTELATLSADVEKFQILQTQAKTSSEQLSIARNGKLQLENLQKDLDKLRQDFSKGKSNIDDLAKRKSEFISQIVKLNLANANLETIESSKSKVTQNLANLRAVIEKDKQFEEQVQNGLCPILTQKCLNLGEGENLSTYFKAAFSTNTTKLSELVAEQNHLEKASILARDAEKLETQLENAKNLHDQITENGKRLKDEASRLEKLASTVPTLESETTLLETKLKTLGNPLEREKRLTIEAEKAGSLKEQIGKIETTTSATESRKANLLNDIKRFDGLAEKFTIAEKEVEKTQSAQRIFLELQGLANLLKQREIDLQQSKTDVASLEKEFETATKENSETIGNYKESEHLSERENLSLLLRNEAVLETELRQVTETIRLRETEISRLRQIQAKLIVEKDEESRLKKVAEATTFISDTLKKAAPEVAKMLLSKISQEANLFFREMTGNAERTLSWKDDYEISLEEGGYPRPFSTLSGGEQMSASLSVRLALLQELSDIRFAFFDEPTTNLDAERREKLALAINGISQKLRFSQIFVVSHDDTFESHTDYVISVNKEN